MDGHETTQTFTLCGWWEYDEAIVANHILIPESRADAILTETGVVPGRTTDGMTGTYNMDVMLKGGARNIEQDLDQILENHGYQAESPRSRAISNTGVNWGYTGAQLSDSMDPLTMVIAIGAVLSLILFTGYLIIYNVFQISVTNDIRFYGLLKTIGTTGPAAATDHPAPGPGPLAGGYPSGAAAGLAHRGTAHSGDRPQAGRGGARVSVNPLIFWGRRRCSPW